MTALGQITIVGVPDRVGEAADIFSAVADADVNIDMIVQNVSREHEQATDISFTLAQTRRRPGHRRAPRGAGAHRLRGRPLRRPGRQGLRRRRRHALPHPGVTARFFRRWRTPA